MFRMNKMISTVVLVCFLFNTAIQDLAFGLATPSILTDIVGIEHKDMGRIKLALEEQLIALDHPGLPVSIGTFQTILKEQGAREKTIFQPADMQFFFHEITLTNAGLCTRVRIKDKYGLRTYYAVFSRQKDEKGGFPITVYTEEQYKATSGLARDVPQIKTEDAQAIEGYVRQEKGIDTVIAYAHEKGLAKKPAEDKFDFKRSVVNLLDRFNIKVENPNNLIPIEDREFFLIPVTEEIKKMMAVLPRAKVVDINGQEHEVTYFAHSSNNAMHVFVGEKDYRYLTDKDYHTKSGISLAVLDAQTKILHEIGAICNQPILRIEDGDLTINALDERMRNIIDGGREGKKPLTINIANLDHVKGRDYTAGGDAFDLTPLREQIAKKVCDYLGEGRAYEVSEMGKCAVPVLVDILEWDTERVPQLKRWHNNGFIRYHAVSALFGMGPAAEGAKRILTEIASSPSQLDLGLKDYAALVLRKIELAEKVLDCVVKQRVGDASDMGKDAVPTLVSVLEWDTEEVPQLETLQRSRENIRYSAVLALVGMGPAAEGAERILTEIASSPNQSSFNMKDNAALALRKIIEGKAAKPVESVRRTKLGKSYWDAVGVIAGSKKLREGSFTLADYIKIRDQRFGDTISKTQARKDLEELESRGILTRSLGVVPYEYTVVPVTSGRVREIIMDTWYHGELREFLYNVIRLVREAEILRDVNRELKGVFADKALSKLISKRIVYLKKAEARKAVGKPMTAGEASALAREIKDKLAADKAIISAVASWAYATTLWLETGDYMTQFGHLPNAAFVGVNRGLDMRGAHESLVRNILRLVSRARQPRLIAKLIEVAPNEKLLAEQIIKPLISKSVSKKDYKNLVDKDKFKEELRSLTSDIRRAAATDLGAHPGKPGRNADAALVVIATSPYLNDLIEAREKSGVVPYITKAEFRAGYKEVRANSHPEFAELPEIADNDSQSERDLDELAARGILRHIPGSPNYEITNVGKEAISPVAFISKEATAAVSVQDEVTAAITMAGEAGLRIPTHPSERYSLLVTSEFFASGELKKHQFDYADRFNLDVVSGSTADEFIRNVLSNPNAVKDKTIVLLPNELAFGKFEDKHFQALKDAGIRFMIVNRNDLMTAHAARDAYRAKFQQDTYAVMLLMRAITDRTGADSPIYRLLSFYLKTHFNLSNIAIDDYIMAIANNEIGKLINGILMYRPAQAYDKTELGYDKVAATLLSA